MQQRQLKFGSSPVCFVCVEFCATLVYAQLGNAVPPPLVAAVVAALLGKDPDMARRLALEAIKVI